MRPRDYFEKHVWMGGSLMKRYEAEMRHEIGIDKLMWGADYPHLEGAAPVHRETLRYIFGGLPEDDLRRILGANAVDLWGFDGACCSPWPTASGRPWPTWPRRWRCPTSRTPSAGAWPGRCRSWRRGRPRRTALAPLHQHRTCIRTARHGGPPEERSPRDEMRRCSGKFGDFAAAERVTTVCFHRRMELETSTRHSRRCRIWG